MKTPHSSFSCSRRLAILALTSCLISGHLGAEQTGLWEVKTIDGEEYIPVGKLKTFYQFRESVREGGVITLESGKVSLIFEVGSTNCRMNGVRFILAKPVKESAAEACISREDLAGLIDPALRPNFIKGAGDAETVILDAPAGDGAEQALKIAGKAKESLENKGFKVVITGGEDAVSWPERVKQATESAEDSVVIGISFASGPPDLRGIETTCSSSGAAGSASVALSTCIHGSITRRLGKNTTDGGIRRDSGTTFSGIAQPAILIKAGNFSHPYEARLIGNDHYQDAVAGGIVDGVVKYRSAVTHKPAVKSEEAKEVVPEPTVVPEAAPAPEAR
jgi:N-acetylmuramoyl-L-alanine amidase